MMKTSKQAGFTIIELLIATTILSVILLLVAGVLTGIGGLYYKGLNLSRTQQNSRVIIDDISQQLQYTDSLPNPGTSSPYGYPEQYICIGTIRYVYVLNKQIGDGANQFAHVLIRETGKNCSDPLPDLRVATLTANQSEMIAANSRLYMLNVNALATPYTIEVGTAYGEDDALMPDGSRCKGSGAGGGDQYCATSHLTTRALKRV